MNRRQRGRRVWHHQLGIDGEKRCYGIKLAVIDAGSISVHHIAERGSVARGHRHDQSADAVARGRRVGDRVQDGRLHGT
jgi:hypothetical protein